MAGVSSLFGFVIALVVIVFSKILSTLRIARRPPIPPGPNGLPFLGNLRDMPQPGELEFLHWLKLKEVFGPISSITVLGQTIIVLNDMHLASEMLEKRSAKHSSRPRSIFAGEMVGWENALALLPYGHRFRTYRRHMSRVIGSQHAAATYNSLQEAEAGYLLLNIMDEPDSLIDHIKRAAGSVILKISYGYNPEPHNKDYLIDLIGHTLEELNQAGSRSAFMFDAIPFLKFIPDWLPGMRWKQKGKKWRTNLQNTADKPFDFVRYQMAQGRDDSSYVSNLLTSEDLTEEEEGTIKWSALSMYSAGAETTVSSIACFFLLMAIHPNVQRRAQEEIDQVVGSDRLPKFSDRARLPYVESVVKELLRWHPVAPMGLPHTSSEDDIVEGYFIPKDALIFANIWHFTHDANVYTEPMEFNPERFLPCDGREPAPDPHRIVFGFGRRVCPGRIIADNALFITFAQSLAAFTMSNPIVDGKEVEQEVKLLPGIITHPDLFQVSIKPRSAHHEMLVRAVEQNFPRQESDAEVLENMGV